MGLDALDALKEKQAKRRIMRAEEEKKLLEQKKLEDERKQKEEAELKAKEAEKKRLEMEDAEKKRQEAAAKKSGGEKKRGGDKMANIAAAMGEKGKTKEQLAEEKRVALAVRVAPLVGLEEMNQSGLGDKASEFWKRIVKLETEKYDLEMRMNRQDYDIRELRERQKQQLRQKALKKGLDPEALTGKHPPKIQTASKFERRPDSRTYDDKKKLFEGGRELEIKEELAKLWELHKTEFEGRSKVRLPKWFGERPGKKKGEPNSDGEEEEEEEELLAPPPEAEEEEEEEEK